MQNGHYKIEEISSYLFGIFSNSKNFEREYEQRLEYFKKNMEDFYDEYGKDFKANLESVEQAKVVSKMNLIMPSIFLIPNGNIRFVFDSTECSVGVQFLGNGTVQLITTR